LDKQKYDVSIVIFNSKVTCYSTDLNNVRFIDLKTLKASKSFFALYKLLKEEKPHTVFSTMGHVNILVSLVAPLLKSTRFIARASNVPSEQILYEDLKTRFYELFTSVSYKAFNQIICQTKDMESSILDRYGVDANKTLVIHNPLLNNDLVKTETNGVKVYKLLVVARFAAEKGLERLIDVMAQLPSNYQLSMAGKGQQRAAIENKVKKLNLTSRVTFLGEIRDVQQVMLEHDLLVLSSFTEGFPNAVIEALAVGLPVVTFKVSGVNEIIKEGFNGYVVPQNDVAGFKEKIIEACTASTWNYKEIKADVYTNFNLNKITQAYEQLIN